MFDSMIKEKSLGSDSSAAWEIKVIVRTGYVGMNIRAFRQFLRQIGWYKVL